MQPFPQSALAIAGLIGAVHLVYAAYRTVRPGEGPTPDSLGRRWIPVPELGFAMFAFFFSGFLTLAGRGMALHEPDGMVTLKQFLAAAVVFGYAAAVLSRLVRRPGRAGRRVPLRAALLLGLPAVSGVLFAFS